MFIFYFVCISNYQKLFLIVLANHNAVHGPILKASEGQRWLIEAWYKWHKHLIKLY